MDVYVYAFVGVDNIVCSYFGLGKPEINKKKPFHSH